MAHEPATWESAGGRRWDEHEVVVGDRTERWIVVQSEAGLEQHLTTLQRRAQKAYQAWTKRVAHLAQQEFACQADAQVALY